MNNTYQFDCRKIGIKTPHDIISIEWEVTSPIGSGSTQCEAWRGQYEIDSLERAGYCILNIKLHK